MSALSCATTKEEFKKGIHFYQTKDIKKALDCFKIILDLNPKDKAARLYHSRCIHFQKYGIPEEWDGISDLDEK